MVRSSEQWFREWRKSLRDDDVEITPDRNAVDILENCRYFGRDRSWTDSTNLREAIAHLYFEQENGKQLEEISRGSFGEDSTFDFDNRTFFQNDDRGSSWLIREWIDDHIEPGTIRMDSRVTHINYEKGKDATVVAQVRSSNDNKKGRCVKKFRSKYVIATPSIKVLRDRIKFRPSADDWLDNHPLDINVVSFPLLQENECVL